MAVLIIAQIVVLALHNLSTTTTAPANLPSPTDLSLQLITGLAALLIITVMFLITQTLAPRHTDPLGLNLRKLPRSFLHALLALAIILAPLLFANIATAYFMEHWLHRPPNLHPVLQSLRESPPLFLNLLLILNAAILAPLSEEFFFRGFLQSALIQTRSFPRRHGFPLFSALPDASPLTSAPSPARRWFAILLTSALFTLIHQQPEAFPTLFVLALGLGYLYERTGSLWAPISLHVLFNSLSLLQNKFASP